MVLGEIKELRAEDGGSEEPQEDEARHHRVAHLRVGGEVPRGALPQRVEQPAHGRRARRVRRRDRREHLPSDPRSYIHIGGLCFTSLY